MTSYYQIPKWVPDFSELLAEVGRPHPKVIAKSLGVTERTIYRWINVPESAPKTALLSLFWLTKWGHSINYGDLRYDFHLQNIDNRLLRDEIKRLNAELEHVLRTAMPKPVEIVTDGNVLYLPRRHQG